jgi:hypothetical protein
VQLLDNEDLISILRLPLCLETLLVSQAGTTYCLDWMTLSRMAQGAIWHVVHSASLTTFSLHGAYNLPMVILFGSHPRSSVRFGGGLFESLRATHIPDSRSFGKYNRDIACS